MSSVAEFTIVGVNEGRGKAAGTPVFTCQTISGERFSVSMEGDIVRCRQMCQDRGTLIGKPL